MKHGFRSSFYTGCLATVLGVGLPRAVAASTNSGPAPDIRRDAAVAAVAQILPSVVNIAAATTIERRDPYSDLLRQFFGPYNQARPQETRYSRGSGLIIDKTGYVLTNEHVIEGANQVWVKLNGQGNRLPADVIAVTGRSDLALLKIRAPPGQEFVAAHLAQADDLLLGETVLALGNPFGLGGSVSRGILSSKSRRPPRQDEPMDVKDWLQTDAAINPGNSGGPLIDLRAQVIGINVAVLQGGQGIGFAIPIKRVRQALREIFTPEALKSLWFGANLGPLDGPPTVQQVEPGSPAAQAGLEPKDVVVRVDGHQVSDFIELSRRLIKDGGTQPIRLLVRRGRTPHALTLRLVPLASHFNADLIRRKTGASVQAVTPELASVLGLTVRHGLVIAGVQSGSPADAAHLRERYVILRLDGQPVDSVVDAARRLARKKRGDTVRLHVQVDRVQGPFVVPYLGDVSLTIR